MQFQLNEWQLVTFCEVHLQIQSFLKLLDIYRNPHYLHVFYILYHVFYGLYKAKNWCMLIIINKYISIQYFHFFVGSCRQRCKTELFPFDTFCILMSSYTPDKYKHSSICLIIIWPIQGQWKELYSCIYLSKYLSSSEKHLHE